MKPFPVHTSVFAVFPSTPKRWKTLMFYEETQLSFTRAHEYMTSATRSTSIPCSSPFDKGGKEERACDRSWFPLSMRIRQVSDFRCLHSGQRFQMCAFLMDDRRKTHQKVCVFKIKRITVDRGGRDLIFKEKLYDSLLDGLHGSVVTQGGLGCFASPIPLPFTPHRLLPGVQSSKKYEFCTHSREGCNFSTVRSVPRIWRHYILSVWRILWINQDKITWRLP